MSRLESVIKGQYYPLPEGVIPLISQHIVPNTKRIGRILDPCAGEGDALLALAENLELTPFGNELNLHRGEMVKKKFEAIHAEPHQFWVSGIEEMVVSDGFTQLLYLNPPFDHDARGGRVETTFLKQARPWLCSQGVLVFVIPQRTLANKDLAQYLSSWFHDITVYRHPDSFREYEEITLFGHKNGRFRAFDSDTVAQLIGYGKGEIALPVLGAGTHPTYTLAEMTPKYHFYSRRADNRGEIATHSFLTTRLKRPERETGGVFHPLMPLRIGHIANLMAAGSLNNNVLSGGATHVLVKGMTEKIEVEEEVRDEVNKATVYTTTEKVVTTIQAITPDGELHAIRGSQLGTFLSRWTKELGTVITERYTPVYNFKLSERDRLILGRVNQTRTIPGTTKRGLFPAQQHTAVACAMRLRKHREAFMVAEMGTGKTVMAPVVSALIGAKRNLILCPPHLVEKWLREIRAVIPNSRAVALTSIAGIDDWMKQVEREDSPLFGVIKQTDARRASGWHHAATWGASGVTVKDGKIAFNSPIRQAAYEACFHQRGEGTVSVGQREISREKLRMYYKTYWSWGDGGRREKMARIGEDGLPNLHAKLFGGRMLLGKSVGDDQDHVLYSYHRVGPREQGAKHAFVRQDLFRTHPDWQLPDPENPPGKWPLATYLHRKYKGRVKLLIVDEAHEYKAGDSDQGVAFGRLADACQKTLLLTGTIFGGKASTLFYLLYRSSPEFRQKYQHDDLKLWIEEYGVLQQKVTQYDKSAGDDDVTENSKQSGTAKKGKATLREIPGASPAMIQWLLPRTAFLGLPDMGAELPPYQENAKLVRLNPGMDKIYQDFAREVRTEVKKLLLAGSKALLGTYISCLTTQPDAPWRVRAATYPSGQVFAKAPAMNAPPGEYPKEKMILDHIMRAVGEHRKVLLLCQQTETLDITKEWMTMLSERGIKGRVLRCEPNEREAWIAKAEAEGVEVIISHPRRVATGLDILGFPEIVWMGTEFSAYTMAQASRRSWRIGQTKPVQVTFYAYDETMQEKALMLMANKMAAIQQIDGNAVSDDTLADIADVGDVYTILAQSLIKEGEAVSTVEELFQTAHTGWLEEGEVATTLFEQKEAWGYIGQYDPDQVEAEATAISADPTPSTEELAGMSTLFGVTKPTEADATAELTSASSAEPTKPVKWTLADMIRAKNKK